MPNTASGQFVSVRYLVAAFGGLIWAFAFPHWSVPGFAWVVPGLVLFSGMGSEPKQVFRLGYICGLFHYLTGLYWLLYMPVSFFPILGWLALGAFLSLYPGAWMWFCWHCCPGRSFWNGPGSWRTRWDTWFASTTWIQRAAWCLLCATAWVGWEVVQSHVFTGFPWNLLGISQYRMLLQTQIAAFTGVFGVSFLVVWGSVALAMTGLRLVCGPQSRWLWQREIVVPLLGFLGVSGYGWVSLMKPEPSSRELKVALIQPSIPQTMIWDEKEAGHRFAKLLEMSKQALDRNPDLMVWPEASLPDPIRYNSEMFEAIVRLLSGHRTWLALGSDDIVFSHSADGRSATNYYNSAFLLNPQGEVVGEYAKRQLVIFGEYVPLRKVLPFLGWFTPISGGFTPGDRSAAFQLGKENVRFAPLICFEDMFARVVRRQTQQDVQFLLNLTNDGWFGESAQQWQHLAGASFRAIENGMPLVRCCNNGITCWVDGRGRVAGISTHPGADVYGEGVREMSVRVPEANAVESTFYRRHGDVFAWGCLAIAGGVGLLRRPLRKTESQDVVASRPA